MELLPQLMDMKRFSSLRRRDSGQEVGLDVVRPSTSNILDIIITVCLFW